MLVRGTTVPAPDFVQGGHGLIVGMGDFVFEQDDCGLPTTAARVPAKDGLSIGASGWTDANCKVETLEFNAGIVCCELPIGFDGVLVAVFSQAAISSMRVCLNFPANSVLQACLCRAGLGGTPAR